MLFCILTVGGVITAVIVTLVVIGMIRDTDFD
jgi:hypothetical protein